MKEYDQFMQQVKGKQKAPKDGFAQDFGSRASMKAALGYDPNSDFNSEKKPKPILDWSWDKNIQFWTLVIAGIAAIGTLLSGIVGWIPIFKSSPPTSTPSQSPSPTATNKP
jgi:hypothetical protein